MRAFFFIAVFLFAPSVRGETSELKVTDGTLKMPEMPAANSDRSQRSKAAAAAAAAGAAQSNLNCIRMMDEASKTDNSSTKLMMMAVAGQQCSQAQQMQKSASENDKTTKALSAADIPKPASFTAGKTELKTSTTEEKLLSFDENAPGRALNMPELPEGGVLVPNFNGGKKPAEPSEQVAQMPQAPPTTLAPIKPGSLQFDDSEKSPLAPMNASLMPAAIPVSQNATNADGKKETAALSAASSATELGRGSLRSRSSATEAVGVGGGGSDEGRRGGDETFDALMAQLNPGGTEPEPTADAFGPQVVAGSDPTSPSAAERANIFEYAAIRYQKLGSDKRLGGTLPAKAPHRSLASLTADASSAP